MRRNPIYWTNKWGSPHYVADLFHIYNVQMKYPETAVSFDVDKKAAVKSRNEIIKKYKGTDSLINRLSFPIFSACIMDKIKKIM